MEEKTTEVKAFDNMDEFVQVDSEIVEDPQDEGNQVEENEEAVTTPDDVEDPEDGQPVNGEKSYSEKEVAKAIQSANEKTQKQLETVVGLLQDNPEKLAELEKMNPKLIEKLKNRAPQLFEKDNTEEIEKSSKLSSLLKQVLEQNEEADFTAWRKQNKISEADYKTQAESFKDTARSLYDEGLVKTWAQAMDVAGKLSFPHLDASPVDENKLTKLKGQGSFTSTLTPGEEDFDDVDRRLMKKTGLTEQQYNDGQGEQIMAPGIN